MQAPIRRPAPTLRNSKRRWTISDNEWSVPATACNAHSAQPTALNPYNLCANLLQHKSARANRASLVEESAKAKVTAREAARLERQRKLAEILRTNAEVEERGEDVERTKNWEWTIEENEEWEKKKARKARRADFRFHGSTPLISRPSQ